MGGGSGRAGTELRAETPPLPLGVGGRGLKDESPRPEAGVRGLGLEEGAVSSGVLWGDRPRPEPQLDSSPARGLLK